LTEAALQRLVLAHLQRLGIWAWRMNTGGARTKTGFVRFGIPGQADVTGILPDGRRLEIELKSDEGRLSPAQIAFGNRIRANGGIYIAARTLEEVLRVVEPLTVHRPASNSPRDLDWCDPCA
jgi:hypothetical protein